MRKLFVWTIFCLVCLQAQAQEQLGLKIGNYAGVNSLAINPANNVNGPIQWDLNFFSFGFFYESNYIYIERANLFLAGLKASGFAPDPAIKADKKPPARPLYYNYFDRSKQRYNFYMNAFAMAPSATLNYRDNSFGIFYKQRANGYANRISKDYGYYYYADSLTTEMFLDPMKVGLMHWGELGINYGRKITSIGFMDINIGITAKYLMGFDAVLLRNNVRKESIKIENGVKIPEGSDVDFNYATNYKYDYVNNKSIYDFKKIGDGASIDLGITLLSPLGDDPDEVHVWKAGVAILDVGKIWYRERAETNNFASLDTFVIRDEYLANTKDLDSFRAVVNQYAFGVEDHSVTGTTFQAWMPLTISAFFDINLSGPYYLAGHAMVRIPMKAMGLERSNWVALTPRIEKQNFEVGVPIVLYDFRRPRVGLYYRKGIFTIGSDNFSAWIIPQKMSGFDLYMGFKLNGTKKFIDRSKFVKCPVF